MSQGTPWEAPTPPSPGATGAPGAPGAAGASEASEGPEPSTAPESSAPAAPRYLPTSRGISAAAPWILLGAALAIVLGALLPWATLSFGIGTNVVRHIAGTEGDGVITLLLGLVVGLVAVLAFLRPAHARLAGVLSLIAGLAVLTIAIVDMVDVHRLAGTREVAVLVEVGVGSGLWVTVFGGIAAILGSGVLLLARPPAAPPQPGPPA